MLLSEKRESYVIDNSCKSINEVLVSDELMKVINMISWKISSKYKKSCIIHIRRAIVWNLTKWEKVNECLTDDEINKLERFLLDSEVEIFWRQIFEKYIKNRIRLSFRKNSFSEFSDWKIFVDDLVWENWFDYVRNQILLLLMHDSKLWHNPLTRDINFEKEDQLFSEIITYNYVIKNLMDEWMVDLSFWVLKSPSLLRKNLKQYSSIKLKDITIESSRIRKFWNITFYVISIIIKWRKYIAIEIPESIKSMNIKDTFLWSKYGFQLFRWVYFWEIRSLIDYNRIFFDIEDNLDYLNLADNGKPIDEFELFISSLSKWVRLINIIDIVVLSQIMFKIFWTQSFKSDLSFVDSVDENFVNILRQLELIFWLVFQKNIKNTGFSKWLWYLFYNNRWIPWFSRIWLSDRLSINAWPFSV